MALDNYGRIMADSAQFAMMPYNALQDARANAEAKQRRDQIVQNDAARLQFEQQKYLQTQQQAADDDTEWDSAYQAKDWGRMARIDPQTTKILWDVEQSKNPQAEAPKVGSFNPGDYTPQSFAQFMQTQDPSVLQRYQAPERPQQYGPESFQPFTQADGTVVLLGNRGTLRSTDLKGQTKGAAAGGGVSVDPDTGALTVLPDPAKATEGERTSSNYADRMVAAEKKLGNYVPSTNDYAAANAVMQRGPVLASAANSVLSEKGQLYYQAASDWVRAKLRKESGAVISPEEMAQEIKTYFPVPGDSPATIKQKEQARQQAITGMRGMAGRAATPLSQPSRNPAQPASGGKRVRFEDLP